MAALYIKYPELPHHIVLLYVVITCQLSKLLNSFVQGLVPIQKLDNGNWEGYVIWNSWKFLEPVHWQ